MVPLSMMKSYKQNACLDLGEKECPIAGKRAWYNITACSKGTTDSQSG